MEKLLSILDKAPCRRVILVFFAEQKICKVYDFYSVNIAGGKLIQCYHIFGIVVFNIKQIGNLMV